MFDEISAIQLAGGIVRPGVLFRMETTPTVRLWGGAGDLEIPADAIEPSAAKYKGLGDITGLPAVQALINGIAERVDFTLSGAAIDSTAVALADRDAATVRAAQVNMGLCLFGEDWQLLGLPLWLWQGEADTPRISRRSSPGGQVAREISISVGSIFTDRRRPALSYYTDVEQRHRSADDRSCERTSLYSQSVNKAWPRF